MKNLYLEKVLMSSGTSRMHFLVPVIYSILICSAFGPFALETVLISSFGYATDSRDDLRQLCKCVGILVTSMSEGQIERDILLYSKSL